MKFKEYVVLDWYDGPLSYYAEDVEGNSYYGHWVDEDEHDWYFLFTQIECEDEEINIYDLFTKAEKIYINIASDEKDWEFAEYTEEIPKEWLPSTEFVRNIKKDLENIG
jgi:hypothetical protein